MKYCLVEKFVLHSGIYKALRSRSYMSGVPFRDVVTISQNDEPIAYIQLNQSGGVSTILFVDRYDRYGALDASVSVYDRLWNSIGYCAFELIADIRGKLNATVPRSDFKAVLYYAKALGRTCLM